MISKFNKIIKIISLIFLFIILLTSLKNNSFAQVNNWQINSFISELYLNKDGSLDVTEIIDVTFNIEKHGIIRFIPIKYKDKWGNNLKLKINIKSVVNEKNEPYKTEIKNNGEEIRIKIGDPDKKIIGNHLYKINYSIDKLLVWGKNNQDEIYWNVTGTEWEVPINNVKGKIVLPSEIDKNIETYCWTGKYGSIQKNCQIESQKNIINFQANDFLTIAVKFPTNIINRPSLKQKVIWLLEDNWLFFLPFLVFIFMFILWLLKGREPKGKGTIIAEFEPPDNLRPTEIGLLLDNKIQTRDVTATLIDLAVRGYVKIVEKTESKYELILLKNDFLNDTNLKNYEKTILTNIFKGREKINIKDLENKFYKKLETIREEVTKNLVENGYYQNNPLVVKKIYISIFVFFIILGFIILFERGFGGFIALFLSGLIILFFGFKMINKTKKGVETLEKIKGFKLYIDTAERYRVKFQEKVNIFEKILPYAIVFDLADKWAKVFKDIYKNPPSWYEGTQTTFNSVIFVDSINNFDSELQYNITSSPSSSPSSGTGIGGSSGFSGGGFGGGGGSSW